MKTKIEKGLKYLAAAIFLLALAVNVKVTLDDPFLMMNEHAMASSTGGSTSGGCQPVSTSSSTKEVYSSPWTCNGETIPLGIYVTLTTTQDCWTGGNSQNCAAGTIVKTINILGQTVCDGGGLSPVTCP